MVAVFLIRHGAQLWRFDVNSLPTWERDICDVIVRVVAGPGLPRSQASDLKIVTVEEEDGEVVGLYSGNGSRGAHVGCLQLNMFRRSNKTKCCC